MTFFAATLMLIALAFITVPVLVLLVQITVAFPAWCKRPIPQVHRPRIAVLVPAHDEAAGVCATVANLLAQLLPGDRLLVIADNCSDRTAEVARAAGAEVHERFDANRRGKGYALDFGVQCLRSDPPEVMLIIDADCLVSEGAIDRLCRTAMQCRQPVQGLYLMHAAAAASPMKKIAEFAWIVKNQVRPLGFLRLGLPCQLMGTGMAFPWAAISSAALANGHIVEDMKLGIDLARAGTPPIFCPEAVVHSNFPSSTEGTQSQRTRWEHGHISMTLNMAPKLLADGVLQRSAGMVGLALDLCVPPLALLTLLVLALFSGALLLALITGAIAPLVAGTAVLISMAVSILLAWFRYGRQTLGISELAMACVYVLIKIPLYLRYLINRQVEWVRSKRDSE
jgi:cellulose synthase/poly-beta-1,6-N-acetylglucosamine synthase-like glycosyltransferase